MIQLLFFLVPQTQETEVVNESVLDIVMKGGPLGVIIVGILMFLSVIATYIFFERVMTIRKAGKVDESFFSNIKSAVASGNVEGAKAMCQANDAPMSRMILKGLKRIGKPLRDIDAAIENVGNLELYKLEKNLSTLASIAGAAPMIGFFGTVTGMIMAFKTMATEQNVSPDALAGGIYQALITTAVGLGIGIFSFVGYNYLVALVDKVVFKMEQISVEFMDLLQEPTN